MMSERTGSIRPMGSLRTTEGKAIVRIEDRFRTDVDDMWSAITEPERLARWIAQVDGDLRLGGVFRASFTSGWEGQGRVDLCEPPRRLLLTMSPDSDEQTVIEVELVPDGAMTGLVVEERGLPLGEARRARCGVAGPCRGSRCTSRRPAEGRLADAMERADADVPRAGTRARELTRLGPPEGRVYTAAFTA